jgi:hypothetical protein
MRYFVWHCDDFLGRVLLGHLARTDPAAELTGTLAGPPEDAPATYVGGDGADQSSGLAGWMMVDS